MGSETVEARLSGRAVTGRVCTTSRVRFPSRTTGSLLCGLVLEVRTPGVRPGKLGCWRCLVTRLVPGSRVLRCWRETGGLEALRPRLPSQQGAHHHRGLASGW